MRRDRLEMCAVPDFSREHGCGLYVGIKNFLLLAPEVCGTAECLISAPMTRRKLHEQRQVRAGGDARMLRAAECVMRCPASGLTRRKFHAKG